MEKELLNLNGILHVRISFLKKYGFSTAAINNRLSVNRKGKTKSYEHHSDPKNQKVKWIKYNSIPPATRKNKGLPLEESLLMEVDNVSHHEMRDRIRYSLDYALNDEYIHFAKHYNGIYFDQEIIIEYARTHAVFRACTNLKRFGIQVKDIYVVYEEIQNELTFKSKSLKSFYHKLSDFEKRASESLIHGSQGKVKTTKKVKDQHMKQIEKLFRDSKMLSGPEITEELNKWALLKGYRQLSLSTVRRIICEPHFQNRNRPYRNGQEWVDNDFKPFRLRMNPEYNGELWQIDGSRLQIPFLDTDKNAPNFLHLFMVIDVHSRKIIGYSVDLSENNKMVRSALQMAVKNTGYLPKQILKDNGGCFKHKKLKFLLDKFICSGCNVRSHAPGNARDKGQVESLVSVLQRKVQKHYDGYIGEGVKSKRKEARPPKEIIIKSLSKKELRSKPELEKLVPKLIETYNELKSKKDNRSPRLRFETAEFHKDIIPVSQNLYRLLFWERRMKEIKNSMILMSEGSHRQKQFQYIIQDEDLRLHLNLSEVLVCYHREIREEISLYDQNERWICDLKRTKPVRIVRSKESNKTSVKTKPIPISEPKTSLQSRNNIFKQPATLDMLLVKTKNNE